MTTFKVGCCGFPGGKAEYFKRFKLVEVQETFYKLPKEETVLKWRETALPDFEFTMKAWQAITHQPTSPTWKRAGIKVEPGKVEKYGHLKPTEEVFDAWMKTRRIADILKTKIIVIQCPPSFSSASENISNMRQFFSSIDRKGIEIAWEPRGDWLGKPEEVKRICDELDLIHVVDIFWDKPVSTHSISYIRLHGLERRYNYRYVYSHHDLRKLLSEVEELEEKGKEEIYVLFNNLAMKENSTEFLKLLRK